MLPLIESMYLWDKKQRTGSKRNQEMGNIISIFFIFLFFLVYTFTISGKLYPILRNTDLNWLGIESGLVRALGFITHAWWLIFLLFLVSLLLCIFLSFLLTKTKIGSFRTYVEYLKIDSQKMNKRELSKQLISDIGLIGIASIIIFVVTELIVMGISSIFLIFILPIILNITENSLSIVYIVLLGAHIVFFPLILFLYQIFIRRRSVPFDSTDIKEFLTEEGEVNLEKWRSRTWGKKPYTYDWEKEEHIPLTCFVCGSIISSDFTECPICNANLVDELDEIIADYETEEEKSEEESNNISKDENKSESSESTSK
ncbi:MAG: hypothetical protein KAS63_09705 [Candidatus Heimdallarchaeota archaeon]|nr:hypothetical protein [Candidatus Heimdallarchaeota archaeon]MCK4955625.1 hypothetical protein [Candidatus Heimdallarchaeota archaeon]